MQLTLRRASTNSAPGDEVRDELRRDGIEEFAAGGDAEVGDIAEELAGEPEAGVDLEGTVDVWVVDEAFPADGRAGFLDSSYNSEHTMIRRSE